MALQNELQMMMGLGVRYGTVQSALASTACLGSWPVCRLARGLPGRAAAGRTTGSTMHDDWLTNWLSARRAAWH